MCVWRRGGVRRWDCVVCQFLSPSATAALAPKAKMERMESMEPITANYTTSYPEIQPDSGFHCTETTDSLDTTPAPVYDEELVHKVGRDSYGHRALFCLLLQNEMCNFRQSQETPKILKIRLPERHSGKCCISAVKTSRSNRAERLLSMVLILSLTCLSRDRCHSRKKNLVACLACHVQFSSTGFLDHVFLISSTDTVLVFN